MRYSALLLDAAGTLLLPAEPVAETYAHFARRYGGARRPDVIAAAFKRSFGAARSHRHGDPSWRRYWQHVVAESTGVAEPNLFEDLYHYYGRAEAWRVASGARDCVTSIREQGGRVAVVSNWDERLANVLAGLGLSRVFDAIVVSALEGVEKPDPAIFALACERLAVAPPEAVMLGDSQREDYEGAGAAGCAAWLWGRDVGSFAEVSERMLGASR